MPGFAEYLRSDIFGFGYKLIIEGLEHVFPYVGNNIFPIDFHIFQRVAQPPTRYIPIKSN